MEIEPSKQAREPLINAALQDDIAARRKLTRPATPVNLQAHKTACQRRSALSLPTSLFCSEIAEGHTVLSPLSTVTRLSSIPGQQRI